MVKLHCEWDIGQENLVFTSPKVAFKWAKTALKDAGIEESLITLQDEHLISTETVELIHD